MACNSLLDYDGMFDVDNIAIITLAISYLNRSTRASKARWVVLVLA